MRMHWHIKVKTAREPEGTLETYAEHTVWGNRDDAQVQLARVAQRHAVVIKHPEPFRATWLDGEAVIHCCHDAICILGLIASELNDLMGDDDAED